MDSNFVQEFQKRRNKMAEFLLQAKQIFAEAGYEIDSFDEMINDLNNSKFKILVIGEFKRGKSTFINALLGEKILPSAATPCTAIISEVKYGQEKSATIYFNDKIGELPKALATEVCEYINKYKAQGTIPPLTVAFEDLKKYVTITDATQNPEESVAESPFNRAEIFVPSELCKNDVEIIDSPGLNEHKTRDAVANGYVSKADAIIFVLMCKSLAGQTEMRSIKGFEAMGHKSIFFICNQYDELNDEDEQEEIKNRAKNMLLPHTDLGNRGLHFVTSKQALNARTKLYDPNEQKAMEKESGFTEMENCLREFLVNDRGRVKLKRPGEMLKNKLALLPSFVEREKNILQEDVNRVQKKRKILNQELERINRQSKQSIESLKGYITEIELFYRKEIATKIASLPEYMKRWVQECKTEQEFGIVWTTEDEIKTMTNELVDYASEEAETMLREWIDNELKPAIKEKIDEFRLKAESCIKDFQEYMDGAENTFAGIEKNEPSDSISSFLQANGLDADLLGDTLTLGIAGGIGAAIGLLFGSVLSWWVLWPLLLASGGLAIAFNRDCKMEKLKEKVGNELAAAIAKRVAECNASTEEISFVTDLKKRVQKIADAFDGKIRDVDERARIAEEHCRLQDDKKIKREALLDNLLNKSQVLSNDVASLMDEINA